MPAELLMLTSVIIFGGMFVGGVTGFGSAVVTTPLLLLAGLPLPVIITASLTMVLVTRLWLAWRGRRHLIPSRPLLLIAGSVPGLWLGSVLLSLIALPTLKQATGGLILLVVALQLWRHGRPAGATAPRAVSPAALVATGVISGILGTTTSLNGVPAALVLAQDDLSPVAYQLNLAYFFIGANSLALLILALRGQFATAALGPLLLWLPVAVLGNAAGTAAGGRLPVPLFRLLTYVLVAVAGLITFLTA